MPFSLKPLDKNIPAILNKLIPFATLCIFISIILFLIGSSEIIKIISLSLLCVGIGMGTLSAYLDWRMQFSKYNTDKKLN